MPERLECEVLQIARYINTLTFTFLPLQLLRHDIFAHQLGYIVH